MTGVLIRRRNFRYRHIQREDNVKRHKERVVIYKPRREAWSRFFPHSPQEEPSLPTT